MTAKSILHVTTPALWEDAQAAGSYSADSLVTEGFIHCSTNAQLSGVLERHFAGQHDLIALVIDPALLRAPVRFENLGGGDEKFPHIYGSIPVAAVTRVMKLANGEQGFVHGI